jgi:mono/diheme cytochrome c family protein
MSKRLGLLLVSMTVLGLGGCGSEALYLPEGDPVAGRAVFEQFQCYGCHEVVGDSFPAPSAITPTFVALGGAPAKSREYLVESIIAPSHPFAMPQPPPGRTAGDINVRTGVGSRMMDYSDSMTVRQLLDLAAYLETLHP